MFRETKGTMKDVLKELNERPEQVHSYHLNQQLGTFECKELDENGRIRWLDQKYEQNLSLELIEACHEGSVDIAEMLIMRGADVETKYERNTDYKGDSVLHIATGTRSLQCTELLLKHKANPNVLGAYGHTPLLLALLDANGAESAKLLLEHKADPTIRNANGKNAKQLFERAQEFHNNPKYTFPRHAAELEKLLDKSIAEHKADTAYITEFIKANLTEKEMKVIINDFNKEQFNVNSLDKKGSTLLMRFSAMGKVEIVEMLISKGANVNFKHKSGGTALHAASVSYDGNNCIELLIKHKASIDTSMIDGATPLILAAKSGSVQNVELLLEHKADPTAVNAKGHNALSLVTIPEGIPRNEVMLVSILEKATKAMEDFRAPRPRKR